MSTTPYELLIIGTGARTPVGLNAPAACAAVRAGVPAMQDHPFMIDKYGEPMVVAADSRLPAELTGVERLVDLALPPAREALASLASKQGTRSPIQVLVALPEVRPGQPESLEQRFEERLRLHLEKQVAIDSFRCRALGHAGGFVCMEQALSLISDGISDLCLVGGVDSYLEPETLEWLDSLDQLHSEGTIWGFCPGEAAGFCLLASPAFAQRLALSAPLNLLSAASAMEPNRIKTETVCIGEGLSEAFQRTLAGLPSPSAQVNHTVCDMNGEPYRANEYGFAMMRCPGKFREDADFDTPADCWGDVGAASGPLFAVLATFAAAKKYAPGPLALLWASSEGGQRAAALVQATADTEWS